MKKLDSNVLFTPTYFFLGLVPIVFFFCLSINLCFAYWKEAKRADYFREQSASLLRVMGNMQARRDAATQTATTQPASMVKHAGIEVLREYLPDNKGE
jgi:hypothetical protein